MKHSLLSGKERVATDSIRASISLRNASPLLAVTSRFQVKSENCLPKKGVPALERERGAFNRERRLEARKDIAEASNQESLFHLRR